MTLLSFIIASLCALLSCNHFVVASVLVPRQGVPTFSSQSQKPARDIYFITERDPNHQHIDFFGETRRPSWSYIQITAPDGQPEQYLGFLEDVSQAQPEVHLVVWTTPAAKNHFYPMRGASWSRSSVKIGSTQFTNQEIADPANMGNGAAVRRWNRGSTKAAVKYDQFGRDSTQYFYKFLSKSLGLSTYSTGFEKIKLEKSKNRAFWAIENPSTTKFPVKLRVSTATGDKIYDISNLNDIKYVRDAPAFREDLRNGDGRITKSVPNGAQDGSEAKPAIQSPKDTKGSTVQTNRWRSQISDSDPDRAQWRRVVGQQRFDPSRAQPITGQTARPAELGLWLEPLKADPGVVIQIIKDRDMETTCRLVYKSLNNIQSPDRPRNLVEKGPDGASVSHNSIELGYVKTTNAELADPANNAQGLLVSTWGGGDKTLTGTDYDSNAFVYDLVKRMGILENSVGMQKAWQSGVDSRAYYQISGNEEFPPNDLNLECSKMAEGRIYNMKNPKSPLLINTVEYAKQPSAQDGKTGAAQEPADPEKPAVAEPANAQRPASPQQPANQQPAKPQQQGSDPFAASQNAPVLDSNGNIIHSSNPNSNLVPANPSSDEAATDNWPKAPAIPQGSKPQSNNPFSSDARQEAQLCARSGDSSCTSPLLEGKDSAALRGGQASIAYARVRNVLSSVLVFTREAAQAAGIAATVLAPLFIILDFANGNPVGGAFATASLILGSSAMVLGATPVGVVLGVLALLFAILPTFFQHAAPSLPTYNATEIIQYTMFGDKEHTGNEKCRQGTASQPGNPNCTRLLSNGTILIPLLF